MVPSNDENVLKASIRRLSVELEQAASGAIQNLITYDAKENKAGLVQVAPDPSTAPGTSSSPDAPAVAAKDVILPLNETKTSLIRHSFNTTCEGAAGALFTALLVVPIFLFVHFISTEYRIDRDFLYTLVTAFNVEVLSMFMFGKSAIYRNRTLFCKWPCFFLFAILLILATGGKTGVASAPLALLVWTLGISSCWFYERFKGVNKGITFSKDFIGVCVLVIVCGSLNLFPSLAVLIPVKFLSANYPHWNVVVSGFGFPAFIVVLRKLILNFFMNDLRGRVERGEVAADKVMSTYATMSKMTAVYLTLSNVIVLYLSKTISSCAVSAVLSVATEVGCKLYIVWSTREQFAKKAARIAKGRVRVLKELLVKTRQKDGEVVEKDEERENKAGVEGEETVGDNTSEKSGAKNWDFILGTLAVRWEKEMVVEMGSIPYAAFVVYLFNLSDMPSMQLVIVCVIFFFSEIVSDIILVDALDRFFHVPILRLQHMTWRETMSELCVVAHAMMSISWTLSIVNGWVGSIVNDNI